MKPLLNFPMAKVPTTSLTIKSPEKPKTPIIPEQLRCYMESTIRRTTITDDGSSNSNVINRLTLCFFFILGAALICTLVINELRFNDYEQRIGELEANYPILQRGVQDIFDARQAMMQDWEDREADYFEQLKGQAEAAQTFGNLAMNSETVVAIHVDDADEDDGAFGKVKLEEDGQDQKAMSILRELLSRSKRSLPNPSPTKANANFIGRVPLSPDGVLTMDTSYLHRLPTVPTASQRGFGVVPHAADDRGQGEPRHPDYHPDAAQQATRTKGIQPHRRTSAVWSQRRAPSNTGSGEYIESPSEEVVQTKPTLAAAPTRKAIPVAGQLASRMSRKLRAHGQRNATSTANPNQVRLASIPLGNGAGSPLEQVQPDSNSYEDYDYAAVTAPPRQPISRQVPASYMKEKTSKTAITTLISGVTPEIKSSRHYKGNGMLMKTDVKYPIWQNISHKNWEKAPEVVNGVVRITTPGLYYVYAQVTYSGKQELSAFGIFVNEALRAQCTSYTGTTGDEQYKTNSCYTGIPIYLNENETHKLEIKDLEPGYTVTFKPEKTFFGVMRLGN